MAFAWLRPFGHRQRAQRMPGAGQPSRPAPDDLPAWHVKAGFFAKLYFKFHDFYFRVKFAGGFRCRTEARPFLLVEYLHDHSYPPPGVAATRAFLAVTGKNLGLIMKREPGLNRQGSLVG
jgi:hypothetical protein